MRAQRLKLLHIHLPSRGPTLYPPYTIASQLQEHLRRRQLDFKDASASSSASTTDTDTTHAHDSPPTGVTRHHQTPPGPHPPPPTVVSFTPLPTYTLGRRQTTPLSPAELVRLQAPLLVADRDSKQKHHLPVTVLPSPRGGLTTYHGPGQIVLWSVMDLRSRHHKQFTVRCYSRLLETTTIATLAGLTTIGGSPLIQGLTTDDPGVWVNSATPLVGTTTNIESGDSAALKSRPLQEPAKIAALGVHLRRHISALGTAINVDMPLPEVRDEEENPWARFVPCGLEGKSVTSLQRELAVRTFGTSKSPNDDQPREPALDGIFRLMRNLTEELVAEKWVDELSGRLDCDGVERMSPGEVVELVSEIYEPSEGQNAELEGKYLEWLQGEHLQTVQENSGV